MMILQKIHKIDKDKKKLTTQNLNHDSDRMSNMFARGLNLHHQNHFHVKNLPLIDRLNILRSIDCGLWAFFFTSRFPLPSKTQTLCPLFFCVNLITWIEIEQIAFLTSFDCFFVLFRAFPGAVYKVVLKLALN